MFSATLLMLALHFFSTIYIYNNNYFIYYDNVKLIISYVYLNFFFQINLLYEKQSYDINNCVFDKNVFICMC